MRNVHFDLSAGETLGIVGESGCGKTVLAQSIMRLLPTPPARYVGGSIEFCGEELTSKTEKEMLEVRGKDIGMVFQDPMTSLNPTMTIGKQIMETLILHEGLSRRDAERRVLEMLEFVGISEGKKRFGQYPYEFSGGMRQRVMIAIAIACRPKLLIADEPTTALDVTIQAQILDLLRDLQKQFGMSIILITHDLGIAAGFCDKIMVIYAGRIIESGTVEQVFRNPSHPYTRGLLDSVPRLDQDRGGALKTIPGTPPDLISPAEGCDFCPRCPYAMNICKAEAPHITEIDDGHYASCWLYDKKASAMLTTFQKNGSHSTCKS